LRYSTVNPLRAILLARQLSPDERLDAALATPGMISVANRPLAAHVLDELAAAGVDHVTVVGSGTVARGLRDALTRGVPDALALEFLEVDGQPIGGAIMERIRAADGTILVHSGECLLGDELGEIAARLEEAHLDGVGVNAPGPHGDAPPDAQLVRSSAIAGLTAEELSARLFDSLGPRLLADGTVDTVSVTRGWWYEPGDDSMLAANRLILDRLDPSGTAAALRGESQVQGVASIDPTAIVESSIIRGPVIIGPGARVTDAYVGPYTAIGARAVIENSEIENSMVMEDASIRDLGIRLESSVIGPRAEISTRFMLPRAVRLQVGAGARIALP
jgi:glucose-1-phosphate thymidylyltransferase